MYKLCKQYLRIDYIALIGKGVTKQYKVALACNQLELVGSGRKAFKVIKLW